MTDTAASSPLSELSDPIPPPDSVIEPAAPPHEAEQTSSSKIVHHVAASPLTSASKVTSPSATKKVPCKPRRKSNGTFQKKVANESTLPIEEESCPACQHLDARARTAQRRDSTVWVECDKCETWFHWSCVSQGSEDSPEAIDKWYCSACLTASLATPTPLTISYKLSPSNPNPIASTSTANNAPSVRKSGRATKSQIDYSNLHSHLPASVDRWTHVIAARTATGHIKPDKFKRKKAEELTMEWIYGEEGMLEPFVVETPEGLGMSMPKRDISVGEIAELIGTQTPLEVIDCASQSSLSNWTLGQWAQYYSSPDRDKVRNVISLEVSDTKLGKMVVAPELVRNLDWVDTVWPEDMKQPGQYPRVQKYCLMSVEKCWTDWHVDFAGSSVFYHILKGGKTFYFIRPTPSNLAAYERWSGSTEKQEQEWLGDSCDEVLKIELKEGNTAFLPTGWIHAVYTPSDSIVIGGNFLHSLSIPTQLRIYEIELATKVPKKFRYPHFVKLLWLVAIHYQYHLSTMSLPPSPTSPLPATLSPRVLEGLFALSSFLINQTTRFLKSPSISAERRRIARENVPWNKVADPVTLSREFRKNVLRALGKELDAECFKPHQVEEEDSSTTSNGPNSVNGNGRKQGVKRKVNEETLPIAKSAKIKPATNAGSPPPSNGPSNTGSIISRQTLPATTSTRVEPRADPQKPDLGSRLAEVKETQSSQVVARRWEENGATFVETRTVETIIERVRWGDVKREESNEAARPLQPPSDPGPAYLRSIPYQNPNSNGQYPASSNVPWPPTYPYPPSHPLYPYPYFSQPPQFAMNAPAPPNLQPPLLPSSAHSYPPRSPA
ncbi:hypothetical protein JCM16303_000751 [Sporobolomyces ruberrimus]